MNTFSEKLYFNGPVFIQNIVVSLYGYKLYRERYIGNHDSYLKHLLRSQWYSEEEMNGLTESSFMAIFQHAMQNIPFYRSLVERREIDLSVIKSIADLDKLPIISKEHLRQKPEDFLDKSFKKRDLTTINTSGTTGKTLKIFVDNDSRRHAYAFFSRLKIWAGIDSTSKSVTFAGRTIVPPDANKPPFWRKNATMNNYLFSSYHLSSQNMKYYVDELMRIQPHFIDSYPSSIYTVAKYMEDNNISGIYPKAIITSSETLLDHQRKAIEKVFRCLIYDQYGCAEQVVFISQCEKGTYHIHPEFGIVEFLRSDGSKASPGEPARLICTGFTNRAMPLLRYDIGDTGIFSDKRCDCGRKFPVIEHILGRTDDILIMRDGRQVGRLDPVFKGLLTIREAQIVQEDYDTIVLRIVPGKDFQKRETGVIVHELEKRLGSQVTIVVEMVAEIPRTSAGKFKAVISKVKRTY